MKTAVVLLATIATVLAQVADEGRLYYTAPTSGTVWEAGKQYTVAWNNKCDASNTGTLNIALYIGTGVGTVQQLVPGIDAIGTVNCLTSQSATITLPANLTTSDKYAIHVDTEPLQSYSAPFTIKGIDPPKPSSSSASSSSSAAPSASGSTSANASGTTSAGANKTETPKPNTTSGATKLVSGAVGVVALVAGSLLL